MRHEWDRETWHDARGDAPSARAQRVHDERSRLLQRRRPAGPPGGAARDPYPAPRERYVDLEPDLDGEDDVRYGDGPRYGDVPRWDGPRYEDPAPSAYYGDGWPEWPSYRAGRDGPRDSSGRRDMDASYWRTRRTARATAEPYEGCWAGVGPKGYRRADDRIREDVCDRLTSAPDIDARDITVGVQDGEVMLEGTVADRRTKRAAEDCADEVPGVREVHNRLRVRVQPRAVPPDEAASMATAAGRAPGFAADE